jgi:hypothetical protein
VAAVFRAPYGSAEPSCDYLGDDGYDKSWNYSWEWSSPGVRGLGLYIACRRGCARNWLAGMTSAEYIQKYAPGPQIKIVHVRIGRYSAVWARDYRLGYAQLWVPASRNVIVLYDAGWLPHSLPRSLAAFAKKWSGRIAAAVWEP